MPFSQPVFLKDHNKEDQRFEALFQNASLGMLVANEQGEIVLINNFMVSIFGYANAAELIGKKVELLIPTRFHHHHISDRENFNKNPERRPMGAGRDLFGIQKTGKEFPVEISLSSYTNDEGFFVIGFVSDISKRKEIEQSVFDQQKELAIEIPQLKSLMRSWRIKLMREPGNYNQPCRNWKNRKLFLQKHWVKKKILAI